MVLSTVYDIRIRRIKTSKIDDNNPVNDAKDTKQIPQEISVKEEGNKSSVMEVKGKFYSSLTQGLLNVDLYYYTNYDKVFVLTDGTLQLK